MSDPLKSAKQVCEEHLREQIRYNTEKNILASENRVAERLLARGEELSPVYVEVHAQLRADGIGWKIFLDCVLSTGAFWSPEKIAEHREDRAALIDLNQAIAKHADALADLLGEREELQNRSAFSGNTHYDICQVIHQASAGNGRYESYVKEPLEHLSTRFDMKYWPRLAECVRVIADDAAEATIAASDPLTAAATKSSRPSKADFLRALRSAIGENRGTWLGGFPRKFAPTDSALATLVNVLLDLPPSELIDASYVKNLRRRDKAQDVRD